MSPIPASLAYWEPPHLTFTSPADWQLREPEPPSPCLRVKPGHWVLGPTVLCLRSPSPQPGEPRGPRGEPARLRAGPSYGICRLGAQPEQGSALPFSQGPPPVISWVVRYLTSCFSAQGCPWGQHRPSGTGRPPPGPTLPTRPWQRRLAPWVGHAGPSWGRPGAPSACTCPIAPSNACHTSSKTSRNSQQHPRSIKGPPWGSRTQRPRPHHCPGHLSPLTTPHHRASA